MYFYLKLPKLLPELVEALKTIPKSTTELDLSSNSLSFRNVLEIKVVVKSLPDTISRLNLSSNGLGYKKLADLRDIFLILPPNINDLDLSENNIGRAELITILQSLPECITHINLNGNHFSSTDLIEIFKAIPPTIVALKLDSSHQDVKALQTALASVYKINPCQSAHLAKISGQNSEVPSLFKQVAFFAHTKKLISNEQEKKLPFEVLNILNGFK
ncbi:hypothetical protein ACQUW5_13350 [Legionella sp. CNM-1927-20]|uniref:hypothetical protein n=1 Tax=Legionella sp. CNM-1927-20 TaxID=3422221 RepID=UPI00403AE81C